MSEDLAAEAGIGLTGGQLFQLNPKSLRMDRCSKPMLLSGFHKLHKHQERDHIS